MQVWVRLFGSSTADFSIDFLPRLIHRLSHKVGNVDHMVVCEAWMLKKVFISSASTVLMSSCGLSSYADGLGPS